MNFVDFSDFKFPEIIKIFFDVLRGNRIKIEENNQDQIYDTISFLEFSSSSIHRFFQSSSLSFANKDITQLSSLPIDSIENIFSSHFLHLENENQLSKFVQHQIQENSDYLNFLRYIYFGFVDHFALIKIINDIQFEKVDGNLFEHLKYTFSSNYYLSFENEINLKNDQEIFASPENIEYFFEDTEMNEELKLIFVFYPILLPNVLEIESGNQIELHFTQNQTEIIN
jgi:hypothetical protein